MKPVIKIYNLNLADTNSVAKALQSLGKQNVVSDTVEYFPKNKKISEVVRILRENDIKYQITFTD